MSSSALSESAPDIDGLFRMFLGGGVGGKSSELPRLRLDNVLLELLPWKLPVQKEDQNLSSKISLSVSVCKLVCACV